MDGMDKKGAVPSSQLGSSNGGVVPNDKMKMNGVIDKECNLNETNTQIETKIIASNKEGEKLGNRAVLSRVMNDGVVPNECQIRKRKADDVAMQEEDNDKEEKKQPPVKYIGETSRSGYERLREHFRDFKNLSSKSHMLKHYIEKHRNIKMEEMRFGIKVLKSYTSAFERQIGESV